MDHLICLFSLLKILFWPVLSSQAVVFTKPYPNVNLFARINYENKEFNGISDLKWIYTYIYQYVESWLSMYAK